MRRTIAVAFLLLATSCTASTDPESSTAPSPSPSPAQTAPTVTVKTREEVLAKAKEISPQVTDAVLGGFESVWEISTSIPPSAEGRESGKIICEGVRQFVAGDRKNVTVKGPNGAILATGTYTSECVMWSS